MITHLSASSIDDYARCPRLFYNTRIKKLKIAPTWEMELGTLVHECLAFGGEPSHPDPLLAAAARGLADRYLEHYGQTPLPGAVYEIPFELDFGQTRIKGAIDAIHATQVYERKTTGMDPDQFAAIKRNSRQPPLYLLAARSLGFHVDEVVLDIIVRPKTLQGYSGSRKPESVRDRFFKESSCSRSEILFTERDLELFLDDLQGYVEMAHTGKFPRNPGGCFMYGKMCPFAGDCWK